MFCSHHSTPLIFGDFCFCFFFCLFLLCVSVTIISTKRNQIKLWKQKKNGNCCCVEMKIRIRRAGPQCDAKFVVPSGLLHFVLLFSLALSLSLITTNTIQYGCDVVWSLAAAFMLFICAVHSGFDRRPVSGAFASLHCLAYIVIAVRLATIDAAD